MINRNRFNICKSRKILHKVGKHWITVSVVLLGLMGVGAASGSVTHASNVASANNNVITFAGNATKNSSRVNNGQTTNVNRNVNRPRNFVRNTNPNRTVYLNVPYVSQWRPISAPEGCAEASLTMLLRYEHRHVNLRYIYNHLPQAYQMRGGQVGNAYGTNGFGHVIKPYALTRYAHRWDKNVRNISGASVSQIKNYVQSGHPVLFYGYSSYQLPGDPNRNHCKVITAYRHGYFRVYDPLYYSKYGQPGTQGRNMMFDRGAVSWYSWNRFAEEYAHMSGSNKKCALTILGKPHFEHFARRVAKHVAKRRSYRRARQNRRERGAKSSYPSVRRYNYAERTLANRKYNYSVNVGRRTSMGRSTMAADKEINRNDPFNRSNYEAEYLFALNHPALIDGAQDHLGGMMTGIKDGLNDYGQYAAMNATKQYAKRHHENGRWLRNNLVENNRHGFYYWYFTGFNDNNGGDASDTAKAEGHRVGLTAYHAGLHKAQNIKNSRPTRGLIRFTMNHLGNTILSERFEHTF